MKLTDDEALARDCPNCKSPTGTWCLYKGSKKQAEPKDGYLHKARCRQGSKYAKSAASNPSPFTHLRDLSDPLKVGKARCGASVGSADVDEPLTGEPSCRTCRGIMLYELDRQR